MTRVIFLAFIFSFLLLSNSSAILFFGSKKEKTNQENKTTETVKQTFVFLKKSRYIANNYPQQIPFQSLNNEFVQIEIREVYPQNIHYFLANNELANKNLSDVIRSDKLITKKEKDILYEGNYSTDFFKKIEKGIYQIQAISAEQKILDSTIIIVSDIAATVKMDKSQNIKIWAMNNHSLKPMSDIDVSLRSESNTEMGHCKTKNKEGFCEIKWSKSKSTKLPFAIYLSKGKEFTYLRLIDLSLKKNPFQKYTDGSIYSPRNIYFVGEVIPFAAQIRNPNYEAAKNQKVIWKIFNPKGVLIKEHTLITNEFGNSFFNFEAFQNIETGVYGTEISADNKVLNHFNFEIQSLFKLKKLTATQQQIIPKTESKAPSELSYAPIPIATLKETVNPNEKINVIFQPPFTGRLLIAVESSVVHSQKWIQVDRLTPLELELTAPDTLPNFYITALMVKNGSTRAWGAKSIQVYPKKHFLHIKVDAPKETHSLSDIHFKISNLEKTQVEYSMGVIDEEILKLTNFKSPNTFTHFFAPRSLGVETSDSLGFKWTQIVPETDLRIPLSDSKINFNDPSQIFHVWIPSVKSSLNGNSEVHIKLPNFYGKLKYFIMAHSKNKMGMSDGSIEVLNDIKIDVTPPTFLIIGDQFEIPFHIKNMTNSPQDIKLNIETIGPISITNLNNKLTLNNKEEKKISIKGKALLSPESITIKASAQLNNGQVFWQNEYHIPVDADGVEQKMLFKNKINTQLDTVVALPPYWSKNYLSYQVTASELPFVEVFGNLKELLNMPYENLEQISSKLLALVSIEDLFALNVGHNNKESSEQLKALINDKLTQLIRLQNMDGGFEFWLGNLQSHPWGSAYATYVLYQARKAGFNVPEQSLQHAEDFLYSKIKANITNWGINDDLNPEFLLSFYVLTKLQKNLNIEFTSLLKKINFGQLNLKNGFQKENFCFILTIGKLLKNTTLFSQLSQHKISVQKIVTEAIDGESDQSLHFWTPLRYDSLRLALILEEWDAQISTDKLIERITTHFTQNKSFFNSQELAWTIYSMALLTKKSPLKKINWANAKLNFNNKILNADFFVHGIPVWNIQGLDLSSSSLKLTGVPQKFDQNFFFTKVTGFTAGPPQSLSPLTLQRIYFSPDGSEADETQLKKGDSLIVELRLNNSNRKDHLNFAITDKIPAGFEIEELGLTPKETNSNWMSDSIMSPEFLVKKNNQLEIYGTIKTSSLYFYYKVRAKNIGSFTAPSGKVELMYNPEIANYTSKLKVQIEK